MYGAYAQAAMNMAGSYSAMQAAKGQYAAATQQSIFEWREASRQQDENELIADEQAEARMRQADANMGALVAAMADNGGAGTTNAAAFAGEIGYLEGLDLRAIDRNRKSVFRALEAKKTASQWRAINLISGIGAQVQGTIWNNASKAISALGSSGGNSQTDTGNFSGQGGYGTAYSTAYSRSYGFQRSGNGTVIGGV